VQLAAASVLAASIGSAAVAALSTETPPEDHNMDELLEQLIWLLNMPVGSTADDVKAQLQKLVASLSEGKGVAAASVNLPALLETQRTQIAALSANQVDPAKYVPIAVMNDLRNQLAEANGRLSGQQVDEMVTAALSDGRLLPAQESWARDLGKSNVAALNDYLKTAQPIAALRTTQTGGRTPVEQTPTSTPVDGELAVCRQLGISADDFAKAKGANK
jgi:phage I-like protein